MNKENVKLFACSRCSQLRQNDTDDNVYCNAGADPQPKRRTEYDRAICAGNFKKIDKPWHYKFSWEVR